MVIGQKLRELRESKKLSQGEIEKRTGLLRCYTSRVENGHTVPNIETLEKYALALEVPLYRFFTDVQSAKRPKLSESKSDDASWGSSGKQRSKLKAFAKALARMDDPHRKFLMAMALHLARRNAKA